MRPSVIRTCRLIVRPFTPRVPTTAPFARRDVRRNVPSTALRYVSPSVPSTTAWNFVSSDTGCALISRWKSGVCVSPLTSIRSSRPVNCPVELRMPPMPSIVSRFAFSNVNWPASGVDPGSLFCQGPNVPLV